MDTRKVIENILTGMDGLHKLENGLNGLLQSDGFLNVFCQIDSPLIHALQDVICVQADSQYGDIVAEISIGCGKGIEERIDMLLKIGGGMGEDHGTDAG